MTNQTNSAQPLCGRLDEEALWQGRAQAGPNLERQVCLRGAFDPYLLQTFLPVPPSKSGASGFL